MEHPVCYEETSARRYKRLCRCVLGSTLGDYLDGMLLHAAVFPETAYRLDGFTPNAKNRSIGAMLPLLGCAALPRPLST